MCWCGCLSGARCRLFAYGPANTTASQNPIFCASFKSRLVLPFWYQLTQVVLEKRPLNRCSVVVVVIISNLSWCWRARIRKQGPLIRSPMIDEESIRPGQWFESVFYASSHPVAGAVRYNTRCYFNVRRKADVSQLNLPCRTKN